MKRLILFATVILACGSSWGRTCNRDLVKEIGIDQTPFPGKTNHGWVSCPLAQSAAAEDALNTCRYNGYLNCRIEGTASECTVWNGHYYSTALAMGERKLSNMTEQQYKTRLCQRVNECLFDNIEDAKTRRIVVGIGRANGCLIGEVP